VISSRVLFAVSGQKNEMTNGIFKSAGLNTASKLDSKTKNSAEIA